MWKRGRILVVVFAAALLAVLVWAVLRASAPAPEPVYNGKPLSYWLGVYSSDTNVNGRTWGESEYAIQEIGTNAIPIFLQMLRAHDSLLKTKVLKWASRHRIPGIHYRDPMVINIEAMDGFSALGVRASNAVPELIKILDQNYSSSSRGCTAFTFAYIGPEAKLAVPALLRAATSTNEYVYGNSITALGGIQADPKVVVPVLIRALQNSSPVTRWNAVYGLGNFHGDAKSAVPALVAMLNDTNLDTSLGQDSLHSHIEHALQQIDPETYASVVTNAALESAKK
jgi:hypothetical protein